MTDKFSAADLADKAALERDVERAVKLTQRPDNCPLPETLENIEPQETSWLIHGALPSREISLLSADGGTGKGLITAQLIASVTTGKPCPFFGGKAPARAGNVVIFAGEDDPARVLIPRLMAAGADLRRIRIISTTWFFSKAGHALTLDSPEFAFYADLPLGEAEFAPDLVIVDPLQSFLPANVNMISRNEMRAALTPFASLCARNNACGLIVLHTNKRAGVAARNRISDSSDLWDLARAVWMLGRTENDGEVYLSNEKNNYAPREKTALLEIVSSFVTNSRGEEVKTAVALFEDYTELRDADYQKQATQRKAVTKQAVRDAILDHLNETPEGMLETNALRAAVREETGSSDQTYNNAAAELSKEGLTFKRKLRNSDGSFSWFISRSGG